MKTKILFIALFVCAFSWGQILTFDFVGFTGSEATGTSNFNNANLTSSTISRGAGLTALANADRFNAEGWAVTNIANAVTGNDYMEFTITPNSGFQFSVSSIFIQLQRSGTGPSAVVLRSSVDSYAANLDTQYNITDNTATQNFTFTFAQANSTTAVTYRMYMYAEAATGSGGIGDGAGNDIIVNGTVTSSGITSAVNGNWYVGSTWVGGVVPTAAQNVIINHNVSLDGNVTRNAGTTTLVNAGAARNLFTLGNTYTNNGTTTIDGMLTINAGGFVNGTTNLVYGSASTLVMGHNNSTSYVINTGQRFWPVANPPFNVTIIANSPTQLNMVVGPVNGQLTVNGEINVATANALTVNGTLRINVNGFVSSNSPLYGNASTLTYSTGGTYGRGQEWRALGIGTIGTTPGYPNNVIVQANTALDYVNTTIPNVVGIKAMAGNLFIAAGSALDMSTGSVSVGGPLIVAGNIVLTGNLVLGVNPNDDLKIGGNFTNTGVFNGNNRAIFFTRNGTQTISSTPALTIPYIVFEPVSGNTLVQLIGTTNLTVSAPNGGNAIAFSSAGDILDINSRTLTIGTTGVANVIAGVGAFRGSVTSTLTIVGTGTIGTLSFSGTPAQQTLANFTVDRTSGAIACVMGSPLTVVTTMNLTAGIVDLDASRFTLNAATVLNGASATNYFIADRAFGGNLRKGFIATGSFTFPIGDKTGTRDYSPATFNLTAGTGMVATSFIGMSVDDSKHPTMNASTDFISRFWAVTRDGTVNSPTYTVTGTYLPADINGTESNSLSQFWNGSSWSTVGTALAANTLVYAGAAALPTAGTFDFTAGRREQEINIRQGATSIASAGTYNFGSTPANTFIDATFTIENLGNANLTVFAIPILTGSTYSLLAPIVTDIVLGSNGTATFTIRFNPLTAGTFTGSISFANTDSDENPYVINFTGIATGSVSSDILRVTPSEQLTIPSTSIGTISTVTDGIEVWRFNLRDGGATVDADALPTTMTDLVITQSAGDQIGNWDESIEQIVLVNLNTNTIVAYGLVTPNQIQFNTISVVAADNSQVLLGLRLTLKCALGTGAIDGDDFGFTISNPNVTFAASGSGKTTFSPQTSANSRNVIAVVATRLRFTTQPITTGVNTAMASVVVTATDNCGNVDLTFTGAVSLTSTGTMNPIIPINAVAGIVTFTGIIHSVTGIDFILTASSGSISGASALFDISTITVLNPGDLAVLAVNTNVALGTDEITFVCFRDLLPGTNLFITDNGYERVNAGFWGGTEGVITITRSGTLLPRGTIITIRATTANITSGSHYNVYTCGAIDTNWTKSAISGASVGGFNLNSNDDIYFMQGGTWTNNIGHSSTYTGNVLYAWTESGWNPAPGGTLQSTAWSTLFPGMECFSTIAPTGDGFVKFDDPVNPDFSTTTNGKFDWITLINDQSNWDSYTNNANYVANGFNYFGSCLPVNLASNLFVNGKWSGRQDTNWFNCVNWETLIVPDETVNVLIPDTTFDREAIVNATAPFAVYSNFIAKANNLTITGEKVVVSSDVANVLEVRGNVLINGTGVLDMNDGNNATADGTIHLFGNWTNSTDETAFDQGNGTVHFDGVTPQIITSSDPIGTEVFYNVVLNNNFDTAISNNLIAQGNLTVNSTRLATIQGNDYIQVNNRLQLNGDMVIENNGQLIQVNETNTNAGTFTGTKFQVKRTAFAKNLDYVYWSSPIENYAVINLPNNKRYFWNPVAINPNATQGNWLAATGLMQQGQGYIARVSNASPSVPLSTPVVFQGGQPFNGQFNKTIARGTTVGINDCWNLVGNPYPSSIDADLFLVDNTNIDGHVKLWMHGTPPAAIPSPFYQNFAFNYSPTDYITYNGTATSVPAIFNGKIASGQGFFIRMLDAGEPFSSPTATANITFKNEYRSDAINGFLYDNSEFFRNSTTTAIEKSRIWMDLMAPNNQVAKTVIGYVPGATIEKDRLFDALIEVNSFDFYSLIHTQQQAIQGRPVPFDPYDQVPMGMFIQLAGNYIIAISAVDGLFSNNSQNIYLEDKYLNVIHDLRATPYTFTTAVGTFDDRFVLRYTDSSLSLGNSDYQNTVVLVAKNGLVSAQSALEDIKSITLYDVLGRQIAFKDNVNAITASIPTSIAQQTIIVKITLANGITVTKKIIL